MMYTRNDDATNCTQAPAGVCQRGMRDTITFMLLWVLNIHAYENTLIPALLRLAGQDLF